MRRVVAAFFFDDHGATAIEYGLIAALIAIGAIASFSMLGNGLTNLFGSTDQGVTPVFDEAVGKV
jgi:pilus assembly protein Flp/PilA